MRHTTIALALLLLANTAHAGCISDRVGDMTFHNCDGTNGITDHYGNLSITTFDDGTTAVSDRVGDMTFTDIQQPPPELRLDGYGEPQVFWPR